MLIIPFFRRIWFKITGTFLVAILPLVAVIIYLNVYMQRDAVEHGRSLMARAVYDAAAAQENIVAEIRQMLAATAAAPAVRALDAEAMDGLLVRLQGEKQYLSNVVVCNRDGDVVASAKKPFKGVNVKHRRYFEESLRRDNFTFGEYVIGQVTGNPVLHFAQSIIDETGRVAGVVAVSINLHYYASIFGTLDVPPDAFVAFSDSQGALLMRYPPCDRMRPGESADTFSHGAFPWRQSSGSFVTNGLEDVETIYAYKRMALGNGSPEAYGVIVVGMPVSAAMVAARNRMIVSGLASIGSVLLAVLMVVGISRVAIVGRLQVLANFAASLKDDKVCRLPPRFGQDEIGVLGEQFAAISLKLHEKGERLAETMDSLSRERDTLSAVVGQLREAHEELQRQARLDYLTGLHNRRSFNDRMREEWMRFTRYGTPFSLILFDIDDFKMINDTHGHGNGDAVLRALSRLALSVVRDVDTVYRVGGEEFAVIAPQTLGEAALGLGERLRARVSDLAVPLTGSTAIRFTISLGVAQIQPGMHHKKSLYAAADNALYAAKRAGKNRSILWTGQIAA
jgi:diguanylate cyclase (GGDEF)-like protein